MITTRRWLVFPATGLVLAACQFATLIALQQKPLDTAMERLVQWDSLHYLRIEEDGYYWRFGRGPYDPTLVREAVFDGTNVAFFPGYPLLSRGVKSVTGLSPESSLILTAILCAAGFWAVFVALLSRWNVSRPLIVAACAAVFTYPPAFFFTTAYSESLFAFSLISMILAYESPGIAGSFGGAVSGFVLGATRIFALPLSLYPLLRSLLDARLDRARGARLLTRGLLFALAIIAGTLSFFLFTYVAFGHFDLYLHAQSVGWNVVPDPLLLVSKPLQLLFPFFTLNSEDGDYANKVGFAVLLWSCAAAAALEWRLRATGLRLRVPLYACALLLAVLSAVAEARNDFQSVLRYLLPSHILLVLAVTHLASTARMSVIARRIAWGAFVAGVCVAAFAEYRLAWDFTHKMWVA